MRTLDGLSWRKVPKVMTSELVQAPLRRTHGRYTGAMNQALSNTVCYPQRWNCHATLICKARNPDPGGPWSPVSPQASCFLLRLVDGELSRQADGARAASLAQRESNGSRQWQWLRRARQLIRPRGGSILPRLRLHAAVRAHLLFPRASSSPPPGGSSPYMAAVRVTSLAVRTSPGAETSQS